MKIVEYRKLRNGKYAVTFESGEMLEVYEDILLQYELLLKKEVSHEKFLLISQANLAYDTYMVALKSLKSRLRSKKELETYLLRKDYPQDFVEKAIEKLTTQGYLDDFQYADAYLHEQMITTSKGPDKIRLELERKQIEKEAIDQALVHYTEKEEREKIQKIITRMIKSNHNRGGLVLKKKITDFLSQQGFSISLIREAVEKISFQQDRALAKREYDKLYRSLSRKYQGYELEMKIKQKMYQKGFTSWEEE